MTEFTDGFKGSVPEAYDIYLVPLMFTPYAEDLVRRIIPLAPQSVLEIAAGSGVVTRLLAPALDPACRFVASDLSPPMLDRARAMQPDPDRVEWQVADALALPFADQSFDVVFFQFGAMFFPDKAKAYAQIKRVLKPGGAMIFNVWDAVAHNDIPAIGSRAVANMFGDGSGNPIEAGPFGYFDKDVIRADLAAGGFSAVDIDTVSCTSTVPSAMHAAIGLCQGTPLRFMIEEGLDEPLETVTEKVAQILRDQFGEGPITGSLQAHVITATA